MLELHGLDRNELLHEMISIVDEVVEQYKTDFYLYDIPMICDMKDNIQVDEKYVWLLRDSGTWLLRDRSVVEMVMGCTKVIRGYDIWYADHSYHIVQKAV